MKWKNFENLWQLYLIFFVYKLKVIMDNHGNLFTDAMLKLSSSFGK